MKMVAINYSNWKAGRMLVLVAILFLSPIAMLVFGPGFYGESDFSVFDFFLSLGLSGFGLFCFTSIATGSVMIAIAKRLLSKDAAIELSEKGFRTNASGFMEKFIPLHDIDRATVTTNHKGHKILLVCIKKEAKASHAKLTVTARWFNAEPALRIFYGLLETGVEETADTINQYIDEANSTGLSNSMVSSTLSDYVNRAA